MRTLALFLILLNIGFFAWQLESLPWLLWQPDQFTQTTWSRQPSDLPTLVLLSEHESKKSDKMAAVVLSQTNIAKNTTSDKVEMPSTSSNQPGIKVENHVKATPLSKLQQAAGLPITPNIHIKDKIQLTSTISCFQTGLYTRSKVSKLAKWLETKKDVISKVQTDQKPISTWVYLPSFKNRQKARKVKQRLNRLGISDYAIVTKGKFNNAISLGLYTKSFNVKSRIKELKAVGYQNVKTQKRYKNNTSYRLNVKMLAGQNELLDILQKNFKGIRLNSVNCKAIALP